MIAAPFFGPFFPSSTGNTTTSLNAAGAWRALSLIGRGKTLDNLLFYVSAVTGAPLALDITVSLQTDVAGVPDGTTIESKSISAAAVGSQTATGFATTLTAGKRYWLVWKNSNLSPGTNFVAIRTFGANPIVGGGGVSFYGWSSRTTTTSGSSWATAGEYSGLRVGYSDGTYDGVPLWDGVLPTGTADGVYANREVGTRLVIPAEVSPRVRGVSFQSANNTGSPTGFMQAKIYATDTPSLVATSANLQPFGAVTSGVPLAFFFSSAVVLTAGAIYRFMLGETTQSDASSNRYNVRRMAIYDDATSKAMVGLSNIGPQKAYYDGTSWSLVDTEYIPVCLILDATQPFASVGGGGGSVGGGPLIGGRLVQ